MKTLADMKFSRVWLVVVPLLLGACNAQSKEPPFCSSVRPVLQPARVLEAIGNGDMQRLVDCGLKPDQAIPVQGQSMTPLQFAASTGRPELVQQVVRAGADPNFGGAGGDELPALEIALSTNKYDSARALMALGARADYTLAQTRMNALMTIAFDDGPGTGQMSRELVSKGASINGKDAKGNTALHWSARSGNAVYAQALLEIGADACAKNNKGQTPADVVPQDRTPLRTAVMNACKTRR